MHAARSFSSTRLRSSPARMGSCAVESVGGGGCKRGVDAHEPIRAGDDRRRVDEKLLAACMALLHVHADRDENRDDIIE